ncbi:hypothetical protein M2271_000091 [Streptomyces sp. LBL]|nr:hypothetical protein [Streptomyces sp. LBL]
MVLGRTPAPPDGTALRSYARLLELIGDACHGKSRRLLEPRVDTRPDGGVEDAMEDLHERLQGELREHASHGAVPTTVLGTIAGGEHKDRDRSEHPGAVTRITPERDGPRNTPGWLSVEQAVGVDGTVSPGLTFCPQGRSFG